VAPPADSITLKSVTLASSVRLQYAERGDRDGHPVVLLHGFTDSWLSFSRVLPSFPRSWRAFAISQRGHGDSDRPATGYGMPDLAADVVAFLDAMALPRVTLVGHSMGSLVAMQAALDAPARIDRLVLVGSAAHMRSTEVLGLVKEIEALGDQVPPDFARAFQESTIHHPVPPEFLARVIEESLKVPARVWRAAAAGQLAADYSGVLDRIATPVLLLRGDHDTLFPEAAREALNTRLPGAVLKIYRDTGHALHWERPAEFVRDLEDFIAAAPAPLITTNPVAGEPPHRFDLTIDGVTRGYLEYSLPDAETLVIHFVEVDPPLRGRHLGERLVAAAVDWAREHQRRIVPRCSYSRAVLARTPEYQDVLK
jgi:pimeloyl-ACP methyl ester carboxylesterase/predicted GNAT family acetyltransferase